MNISRATHIAGTGLLVTGLTGLTGAAARAQQVTITAPTPGSTTVTGGIPTPTFTVQPGQTITFSGTILNDSGGGLSNVQIQPVFTANYQAFFPYVSGPSSTIANGATTGVVTLDRITANPPPPGRVYFFYLEAYSGGVDTGLSSVRYALSVTPEPSPLAAIMLGAVCLGASAWRVGRRRGLVS